MAAFAERVLELSRVTKVRAICNPSPNHNDSTCTSSAAPGPAAAASLQVSPASARFVTCAYADQPRSCSGPLA